MSAVLNDLSNRWATLPQRTRTLAVAAGTLVLLFLLYSAAWRPLQRELQSLRASLPAQTEQLAWMRAQAPVAQALKAKNFTTGDNIMQTVEQTAVSQGVRPQIMRMDAEGLGAVRVTLENVSFNALINWLADLHGNYGAVVDDATVEARPTAGIVNAKIRLRTGGA